MGVTKRIVLFDIDGTLFDTSKFKKSYFNLLLKKSKIKNKKNLLDNIEREYKVARIEGLTDAFVYTDRINKNLMLGLSSKQIKQIPLHDKNYEKAYFNDVSKIL